VLHLDDCGELVWNLLLAERLYPEADTCRRDIGFPKWPRAKPKHAGIAGVWRALIMKISP
jgi:hypothetical protein